MHQGAQAGPGVVVDFAARADRRDQFRHALSIGVGDLRLKRDHGRGLVFGQLGAQPVAFGRLAGQCVAHIREVAAARRDRGHQPVDGRFRLTQLPLERAARARFVALPAITLKMIFAHQKRHRIGRQQPVFKPAQHPCLHRTDRDLLRVVAGAGLAPARAAQTVLRDHRHAAAADPAAQQPGEQVARPHTAGQGLGGEVAAHILRGIPQLVIDDPQLGHLKILPLARRVRP